MSWLITLAVLSALIFFHELGHYLAARFFGVFVEVFSIGFGKKIYGFRAFNTQWQLSAIPLGGYVKMRGQDDSDPLAKSSENDSYNSKKPWQRIVILFAGPLANFILAWIFFLAIAQGDPKALSPVIGTIVAESPASIAGLEPNDRVLYIDNIEIKKWDDLSDIIKSSHSELLFTIERNHRLVDVRVHPKVSESKNMFGETIYKPMVGISPSGELFAQKFGILESISYANSETYKAATLIFTGVGKLITGVVPTSEIGGVVSITKITADAAEYGWMSLLFIAALISVNLGILNLLPIPALDGGHIMFNLYEMIRRKAPSEQMLYRLTIGGWVILLGLMSLGLYNDIVRLTQ